MQYLLILLLSLLAGCSSDGDSRTDDNLTETAPDTNTSVYVTDQVFTDVTAKTVRNTYGAYVKTWSVT